MQTDTWVETAGDRRIRDRERMRNRATSYFATVFDRTQNGCWSWTDLSGNPREGLRHWSDVRDFRRKQGVFLAETLSYCSRFCCRNPRKVFGTRTVQEDRAREDATDQFMCEGISSSHRR